MVTPHRALTSLTLHRIESARQATCPTKRLSTKELRSAEMVVCTRMGMKLRQLTSMTLTEVHGPRDHQIHETEHLAITWEEGILTSQSKEITLILLHGKHLQVHHTNFTKI